MKNIHTILSELGITIPEDKKAELDKAVAENYKTSAEFEKKVNRLTEDFNTEKKRADTAEETLKAFEGIDPANVKTQLEEANKKIKEAQEAAQKQIAERDYNDALAKALDNIQFTSSAARKAIEADIRANCPTMKDGMIVGFTDMIEAAKKADASAFVDDQQQQLEGGKARFAAPGGAGGGVGGGGKPDLGKMSMADYIAARKNK